MLIERKRIPDKIYYSISEVSKFTGVEPHVLRYWETKFSKLKPKRVGGNQRKYTKNDIELVFQIMDLLYNDGFTLDGAEKKIKERSSKKNSAKSASVQTTLHRQPVAAANNGLLKEIRKELEEILSLLD